MKKIFLVLLIALGSCNFERPTQFSKLALNDTVYSLNKTVFSIEEVLQKYKGKKVLIDVWASWCGDCIKGLPAVKNLQKEYPEVSELLKDSNLDTKKYICFFLELLLRNNKEKSFYSYDKVWLKYV